MFSLASLNCIAAGVACLEQGDSIGWCQKSWEQKTRGTGIVRELPRLANPAHVNTYSSGMFRDRCFVGYLLLSTSYGTVPTCTWLITSLSWQYLKGNQNDVYRSVNIVGPGRNFVWGLKKERKKKKTLELYDGTR